jgi:hypothetical protein
MLSSVRKSPALFASLVTFGLLPGCGGEEEFTVDVSGEYTVAVTNRDSSCPMDNWMPGTMSSGILFTITQDGSDVHGTIGGPLGALIAFIQGNAEFDGTVKGTRINLTNYGTTKATQGNCSFTYNAVVDGTLSSNSLSGTITYSPATNDNPDCAAVECSAVQEFSGSRPPK